MKDKVRVLIVILICLIMCGCNENTKVTFYYNCPGTKEYVCDVVDKKLDCKFEMPKNCAGKTFVGWYDTNAHGTLVNLDSDFTENTSLYAYWEKKDSKPTTPEKETKTPEEETKTPEKEPVKVITYTVSFNLNGGSGGEIQDIEVKYKEKMPSINTEKPSRSGYTFVGWYDNSNYKKGTKYYDKNCKSVKTFLEKENIILYAGWKEIEKEEPVKETPVVVEKEYKVSFNLNGGSGGEPKSVKVKKGSKMPSINAEKPTRTGYEFMGWYDNSNYKKGEKYYSINGVSAKTFDKEKDTILYAGWKINTYKIKFNLNGGSNGQTGFISVDYGKGLPEISKSIPSKNGYIFKGWYDKTDYTKGEQYYNEKCEAVKALKVSSNITLYAGWSKVIVITKYQVGFNINGGSGSAPKSVSVALGEAMPKITETIPTRENYIFMGWYDNTDYTKGNKYYTANNKSARSYDKKENIVLYAGWKPKSIIIEYDCNGGSGSPTIQSASYGQTVTLNDNVCKNGDMVFNGWTDSTGKAWPNKWSGIWTNVNSGAGVVNDRFVLKASWIYPVRVATYNIGYFGCGTSKKVKCHATTDQITTMFKNSKVDIVGVQEAVPYKDVAKVSKNAGMNYYYKVKPANINMIVSRFELTDKSSKTLKKCYEKRSLQKAVAVINGVTVSIYNTHYSYQSGCPAKQMAHVASIISNDPNPVILTGDTNVSSISYYEKYLKPIGFEIAAYDGKAHGYCDSVFIISKGHIDVLSSETVDVYGKLSDHNFVVATLSIH